MLFSAKRVKGSSDHEARIIILRYFNTVQKQTYFIRQKGVNVTQFSAVTELVVLFGGIILN